MKAKIVLLVIIWVFVLIMFIRFIFGLVKKRLVTRIREKFGNKQVILHSIWANYLGRKSRGVTQIRGNGALVLTGDELWFLLAFPEKEISIPLKDIKSVSLVKSYLGRTVFRPLLHVVFEHDGIEDSIAWALPEPEKWKFTCENLACIAARQHCPGKKISIERSEL
ncbi:MAG: hypothetical protein J7M18_08045 [Candidatus Eremiobacteraeota bacterium]|nr:hypothetical protein [Candidatus Eremiobacteraeota bacterium]